MKKEGISGIRKNPFFFFKILTRTKFKNVLLKFPISNPLFDEFLGGKDFALALIKMYKNI